MERALPERASDREQSEGSSGRRRPLHGGEIDARHLSDAPGGVETLHASYALILFLDSVGAKDDLAGGANYSAPKIFCTSASKRGSPRSGSRLGSILMYPML